MTPSQIRHLTSAALIAVGFLLILGALHNGITPSSVVDYAGSKWGGERTQERLAYMTFLTGTMLNPNDANIEHDHYFVATRILGHQLMHQPETKSRKNIPFVVLVTEDISQEKRDRLTKDGATVIQVDYLRAQSDWIVGEMPEWRDVMTKLRAWQLTQYDRVAFLDGDMLLHKPLDGLFNDPATKPKRLCKKPANNPTDEGTLTSKYVLASMPEANPFHAYPPTAQNNDFKDPNYFNAGFFVFAPSPEMFEHYRTVMDLEGRFDPKYPEQNLLNYIHRVDGPAPWQRMAPTWNIRFPHLEDVEGGVASVHDKFWHAHMDGRLQPLYDEAYWRMVGFYEAWDRRAMGEM